jgi:hypothetical protein
MALEDLIPDYDDRKAFVGKFTMACSKAISELREMKSNLTEEHAADELETRIRKEMGPDWPLPRPELLQMARGVLEDRRP